MKIVIPTKDKKLCSHFGNCESFTFIELDDNTKKIINLEEKIPEDGISCQSAGWISSQGANLILAGGMGGKPQNIFAQNNIKTVLGCPELPVKDVVEKYMNNTLDIGENFCNGEHHHCHGHGEHSCHKH